MKFFLDDIVVFDEENGTLTLIHSPKRIIVLPRPAALLLGVLANNPGVVMSRSSLMEASWLDTGLKLSGHNLNTYIKVIRHSLSELEIEKEIIRTLPRVGIVLIVNVIKNKELKFPENKNQKEPVKIFKGDFNGIKAGQVVDAYTFNNTSTSMLPTNLSPQLLAIAEKPIEDLLSKQSNTSVSQKYFYPLYLLAIIIICIFIHFLWPVAVPVEFPFTNERLIKQSTTGGCQFFTLDNPEKFVLSTLGSLQNDTETIKVCSEDFYYVFYNVLKFESREQSTAIWCRFDPVSRVTEECSTNSKEFQ